MVIPNQEPSPMAPDKPPPKPTGGGCCSSIAAFLTLGPELRARVSLAGLALEVSIGLGRAPRPVPSTQPSP